MRKLILVGDVHARSTSPLRRKDDFQKTHRQKLAQVLALGNKYEAPLLLTGDVFDAKSLTLATLIDYLMIFASYKHGIYAAPGNHDLYGTSLASVERSPIGVLTAAGVVKLLGHIPTQIYDDVLVCGHSYMHDGKPAPVPGFHNILVTHEMILEDKLWREQEDFTYVGDYLLKNRGWDLTLCGHYHYEFARRVGDAWIVNPGALVRVKASKGDMALKPGVGLYDIEERTYEKIFIEAAPVEEVFTAALIQNPKIDNAEITKFVEEIAVNEEAILHGDLSEVAMLVLRDAKPAQDVADTVRDLLALAEERKRDAVAR